MPFQTQEEINARELSRLQSQKLNIESNIAHCEREVEKYTAHKAGFEAKLVEVEAKIAELV